ncbi:hypothetical protein BDN67DRAFT_917012 [Paxillus ammoniavirescens]|nr:hypothetical protein BDN67DRAFT_917012 [Paxillus ammoniavirescens]
MAQEAGLSKPRKESKSTIFLFRQYKLTAWLGFDGVVIPLPSRSFAQSSVAPRQLSPKPEASTAAPPCLQRRGHRQPASRGLDALPKGSRRSTQPPDSHHGGGGHAKTPHDAASPPPYISRHGPHGIAPWAWPRRPSS